MNIIDYLNPFKKPWWRKEEWVNVKSKGVYKVKEEHDCPSWDLEYYRVKIYKNKESCDVRIRAMREDELWDKTVFQKPEEIFLLSHYDIYEGDKYE